jgi:hypothetical protein
MKRDLSVDDLYDNLVKNKLVVPLIKKEMSKINYTINWRKQYYQDNKELIRSKQNIYRSLNQDNINAKARQRLIDEGNNIRLLRREYYHKNKDKIHLRLKEYRKNKKEISV